MLGTHPVGRAGHSPALLELFGALGYAMRCAVIARDASPRPLNGWTGVRCATSGSSPPSTRCRKLAPALRIHAEGPFYDHHAFSRGGYGRSGFSSDPAALIPITICGAVFPHMNMEFGKLAIDCVINGRSGPARNGSIDAAAYAGDLDAVTDVDEAALAKKPRETVSPLLSSCREREGSGEMASSLQTAVTSASSPLAAASTHPGIRLRPFAEVERNPVRRIFVECAGTTRTPCRRCRAFFIGHPRQGTQASAREAVSRWSSACTRLHASMGRTPRSTGRDDYRLSRQLARAIRIVETTARSQRVQPRSFISSRMMLTDCE